MKEYGGMRGELPLILCVLELRGLAQIHNPDATIDDHQEKLVHDLEYIQTASLWLDIQILWKSLAVVLKK